MDYEQFKKEVKDHILEYLPESFADSDISIHSVIKNNDVRLDGLMIHDSVSNICPNIYLNQYYRDYESGRDFDEILIELASVRLRSGNADFPEVNDITCLEKMKDKIQVKLVNREKNQEYLNDKPFTSIADLAAIYYITLDKSEQGSANVVITNNMLDTYGISVSELHSIALKNMKCKEAKFLTMAEILRSMVPDADSLFANEDLPMYVLTNSDKINGASMLLDTDTMDRIGERIGLGFYILPSSIHETIFLPASFADDRNLKEMAEMVIEINGTQVAPDEILSDHVYRYDYTTHTLEIAA